MGFTKDKTRSVIENLRRVAEQQLQNKKAKLFYPQPEKDLLKLVHELEVHQIELEMQNEELRKVSGELETVLEKYTDLYDFSPIGYFTIATNGVIKVMNLAGARLLSADRSILVGCSFHQFVVEEDRPVFAAFFEEVFKSHIKEKCEVALVNKKEQRLIVHMEAIADVAAEECRLVLIDITERKLADERINEILWQQQAILDNIPNIAWLKDRDGAYVAVNDPFSRIFGLGPEDMIGKSDYNIYPIELAEQYEKNFMSVMSTGQRTYFEESISDVDGNLLYLEKVETPISNDAGEIIGVIGIAHDITSRKEIEVTLRHDNTHDVLTGLYNRLFFDEDMERISRGRMFPVSIVMADINHLKIVNDTDGHEAGDDLIRLAAQVIMRGFRAEDVVARIGGDEFAVLLRSTQAEVAEEAVRRIMNSPEILGGELSIAFGIASADNKKQLSRALKLSDEMMYLVKLDQKKCKK
jgi:diguanylate cyclase (GGDEF)-like protein/PAS domain S-box-containing protein